MAEKSDAKTSAQNKNGKEKFLFPCIICGERFQYPQEVGDHVEMTHLHPACECKICGKKFARPQGLLKHSRSHTNEKYYRCMYCLKGFVQWSHWRRHELIHEGEKKFQCQDCGIYYDDEKEYEEHSTAKQCLNQKFECCGKDFESRDDYIDHQTKRHKRAARNREHSCKYCGKNFAYFSAKRLHEKKHLDKNGVYNPNVKFRTSSFYKRPDQKKKGTGGTGGGNTPATCDICQEKFPNRGEMNAHRKTHPNADNSYPCAICGKVLRSKNSRYLHNFIHAGRKNHKCCFCDKKFTHRQQLRSHERTHTNEKPYSCRFCGKKFAHPTAILPHERSHTGEKPYECTHCGKRFTRFGTHQNHVRLHTGEKPYKCQFCEKHFAQHSTWASHEKTHSGSSRNREPGVRGRPGLRSAKGRTKTTDQKSGTDEMKDLNVDDPQQSLYIHGNVPIKIKIKKNEVNGNLVVMDEPSPTITLHQGTSQHHSLVNVPPLPPNLHLQAQQTPKFDEPHWSYDIGLPIVTHHVNIPVSNPDVYTPQIMGNWGPPY